MNDSYPEYPTDSIICFLCDNGWLIALALAVTLAATVWRARVMTATVLAPPQPSPTAPPTSFAPTLTVTADVQVPVGSETPLAAPATVAPTEPRPAPTVTATPQPANYVIAFVPVHWQGTHAGFVAAAQSHADLFLRESNLRAYAPVQLVYFEEGFTDTPLDSDDLLPLLLAFGLQREPADRYVGLTDVDLAVEGDADVSGYTFGEGYQAVIAEADGVEITAHELGHTYGLCDEYYYPAWAAQNIEYDPCPNPFPPDCPRSEDSACPGQPAPDGRNSIMGPSGMRGDYAFNTASYEHLQAVFAGLFSGGP